MLVAQPKAAQQTAALTSDVEAQVRWARIISAVEPFLASVGLRLTEQVRHFDPSIAPYAQYALTNQGKQLRPVLVALSGCAVGELNDDLITVAVIIEMVHLATLVHDDVMDAAQIRRRRPTLAAHWGNEISVLLGDCLFAQAVRLAASFPTPDICRAVAAATHTVCTGEILQTQNQKNFQLSKAEYFKVVEMKTAELFALSCELGARMAGASQKARGIFRRYGIALGTAYQIFDDCLDLFGSEKVAGKSLGTDLAHGKFTLPLLVAIEQADMTDLHHLESLLCPWSAENMEDLLQILDKYHALSESQRVIEHYLALARESLDELQDHPDHHQLLALTHYLAQQTAKLSVSI